MLRRLRGRVGSWTRSRAIDGEILVRRSSRLSWMLVWQRLREVATIPGRELSLEMRKT